jgi:hypothetical protein
MEKIDQILDSLYDRVIEPMEAKEQLLSANLQQATRLLRDLADLQNGAPLEQYRAQYEQTMAEVWEFLEGTENWIE